MRKQQWRNNGTNWKKYLHGSWRKSETRKKWSKQQGIRAEKFIFTPRWHCKRWFWFACCVHSTRIISISNDSRKSHGHFFKAPRLFRTSSWCSIRWKSGQNGRCINVIEKIQSQNVQIFGYVYQSTNGPNHDPIWKIQSFPSKGICTVILWQNYFGEENWESSIGTRLGKSSKLGMLFVNRAEDCSYPWMWTILNWQARQKTWNRLGKFSWKTLTRENQHHFLTMYIWIALKESVKSARTLWRTTEICSNPGVLLEPRKNYRPELQGNMMQKQYPVGPMTWKVTRRYVWKDIATLQIKRLNNYTKSQLHVLTTINSKKKR